MSAPDSGFTAAHQQFFAAPPSGMPPGAVPYLVAATASSVGVVIGSIGPWASFLTFSVNGVEGDGIITLILGACGVIALFTLIVRGGRSRFGLRWVGPVVGVLALGVALVDIYRFTSASAEVFGEEFGVRVGWGLWMVAVCAVSLCVTAPMAAIRTVREVAPRDGSTPGGGTPVWMWLLIGVLTLASVALVGYLVIDSGTGTDGIDAESSAAPRGSTPTVVPPSPNPGPRPGGVSQTLPSSASPCPTVFAHAEFARSAVGTSVTSCGFAEEVRRQYVSQPRRAAVVIVDAYSPVTGQRYSMACSGDRVVTCTGGANAVVYVF
ncbi:hypothetical protein AAI421_28060 (plasmid) [Rhodococcus aetherivorans]|uniref:hypothetical protein n=1 Tax=Rhodococcus aetherivorans TaxID=191292 RepID=UPI0031E34A66